MAGLSVVDAHHHVWSLARGDYGWLTPAMVPIYRDVTLAEHRAAAPVDMDASVLVQAAPTTAETTFLLDAARSSEGFVKGIVGWAELDADEAPEAIAQMICDPLLKSLRPMLHDLADPAWILRPRVDAALSAMARHRMRLDALVRPAQMVALVTMLDRHPDLAVVLDHAGKPPIASGAREPWASLLRQTADHPRVHCKLSGLATEADSDWTVETLRPWTDVIFDCFGAGRVMWGSDWPVVERNGGIRRWWTATESLLAPFDDASRCAVLGGNARRFYGLD